MEGDFDDDELYWRDLRTLRSIDDYFMMMRVEPGFSSDNFHPEDVSCGEDNYTGRQVWAYFDDKIRRWVGYNIVFNLKEAWNQGCPYSADNRALATTMDTMILKVLNE